ncbi:MAG: DMT family transporter [Alphaproteobacteria bacterium]
MPLSPTSTPTASTSIASSSSIAGAAASPSVPIPPLPIIQNITLGILLALGAGILFVTLDAGAKYLAAELPVAQVVWARYSFHLLLMLFAFPRLGWRGIIVTRRPGLQFVRGLCLALCTSLFFLAIAHIPLPTATAIGFATPFFVAALSVPLLKEQVGWRRWSAISLGFIGVLIVLQPWRGAVDSAALLVVGFAMAYAIYQILTRMVRHYDSAVVSLFYTALIGSVCTSLLAPFIWVQPTPWQWMMLVGLGLCGGLGHLLFIRALSLAPASLLAPFSYLNLLWSTFYGFILWGHIPDRYTFIGAAIIVVSGLYVFHREARRHKSD